MLTALHSNKLPQSVLHELESRFGSTKLSTVYGLRKTLSSDYSWYSPILKMQFENAIADAVVWPSDIEDLRALVEIARDHRVPLIARGGGTGNYGQAVPVNGGIVIDTTRMNSHLEITDDGHAIADSGVRLARVKSEAEKKGYSLRIYPSTYIMSTISGFIAGGSGGIGSIDYGYLWNGNVDWVEMITPARDSVNVSGRDLDGVIHAAGTTGLMYRVSIPLAPFETYNGILVAFDTIMQALRFGDAVSKSIEFKKRVVTIIEPQIASFIHSDRLPLDTNKFSVIVVYNAAGESRLKSMIKDYSNSPTYTDVRERSVVEGLTDFSFNHTTLWSKKADENLTWADLSLDPIKSADQVIAIKNKFGDDVIMHFEFAVRGGALRPLAFPMIRYKNESYLHEIMDFFRQIGCVSLDVHSCFIDERLEPEKMDVIKKLKKENDPDDILNPGKIKPF